MNVATSASPLDNVKAPTSPRRPFPLVVASCQDRGQYRFPRPSPTAREPQLTSWGCPSPLETGSRQIQTCLRLRRSSSLLKERADLPPMAELFPFCCLGKELQDRHIDKGGNAHLWGLPPSLCAIGGSKWRQHLQSRQNCPSLERGKPCPPCSSAPPQLLGKSTTRQAKTQPARSASTEIGEADTMSSRSSSKG